VSEIALHTGSLTVSTSFSFVDAGVAINQTPIKVPECTGCTIHDKQALLSIDL
jgi:hypothetical protein